MFYLFKSALNTLREFLRYIGSTTGYLIKDFAAALISGLTYAEIITSLFLIFCAYKLRGHFNIF